MDLKLSENKLGSSEKKSLYDALLFNETVIRKWKPASEVWPFSYGDDLLGMSSSLGAFILTYIFRKELKIRPYARLTCYVPAMCLPAITCSLFHSYVITTDLLVVNRCPLCVTTKAMIAQAFFGVGFPLLVTPIVCFFMADRLLTYPVPPVKAPKELFLLFQKIIQKNSRPFLVMSMINVLASSFVTYHKQKTLFRIGFMSKK